MLYITLRQYEYTVAVADAGSLTEAAQILNVSQPSLSVAITRVETALRREIFVRRKGAAIKLTPFGHRFVQQARDLLETATSIECATEAERPFVLGCFEDIAPWYLTKALADLRVRFPDTKFKGKEGRFSDLAADISHGRMDVAITYDVGFDSGFNRRKIKQVAPVAFVSPDHPLAKFPAIELHDLKDLPLILSAEELSLGYIRRLLGEQNVTLNVEHEAASLEMMRSLAAHGEGVGISYSVPPTDISYDGKPVVSVPINTPEASADIVLVWTALADTSPSSQSIIEAIGVCNHDI